MYPHPASEPSRDVLPHPSYLRSKFTGQEDWEMLLTYLDHTTHNNRPGGIKLHAPPTFKLHVV